MPANPLYDDPHEVLKTLQNFRELYGLVRFSMPFAGVMCDGCCTTINLPRGAFWACVCRPGVIQGCSVDQPPPWQIPDHGPTYQQIEKALKIEAESN